jgi:hypothetical protein
VVEEGRRRLPVFPFDKVLGIVESAKTFLNSERNAAPDVEQRKKQAEKKEERSTTQGRGD